MRCNGRKRIGILLFAVVFFATVFLLDGIKGFDAYANRRNLLKDGEDFTSVLYDSSNGLPTSEANAIAQSKEGFIYIGGYSGLIRYDGTTFERFDSTTGISSVFSLYIDDKDRLWVGTNENGLVLYDHGNITAFGRTEGIKSQSIRSISEDNDGNIIFATTQGVGYVGSDMLIHPIDDPQVNEEYITQLVKDYDGSVMGLTLDGAIFRMEDLKVTAFYKSDDFGDEPINTIYPRPECDGEYILGTVESDVLTVTLAGGVNVLERKTAGQLKNIKCIKKINNILWLSATNGIGYYDESHTYYDVNDLQMNNSIGNIMEDHEGNIWFTSTRQGVMKLVRDRFTDITKLVSDDSAVVNTTCVNDGILYLGTDDGLKMLNVKNFSHCSKQILNDLKKVRIRAIKNDSKGNIWMCTHGENGLLCYDPKTETKTIYNVQNGLDATKVRDVIECADGSIACSTGNGVFVIKDGKVVNHYGHDEGVNNTEILCLAEDQNKPGKLYFGSDGDGIYVVDNGMVSRLSYDEGLTSGVIMQIKWDEKRQMYWIITSNSIEYMKDGVITSIKNFPYSNNLDIFFDTNGNAWVLSSNGVYIVDVEEMLADEKIEYSFYNTKSGLPYVATGNSRSYIDDMGQLYIAGTMGCCRVNINLEFGSRDTVELAVPSIDVDDDRIYITNDKTVTVPAGSKKIVIDAYALTYGLSNPRISYYLEGFDDAPIHTTKQELKSIVYTNLDGGFYKFHLDVINDKTGEVYKGIVVNINKEGSPYESIWFWIFTIGFTIALIGYIMWRYFQKRTELLMEEHEEDQRFIDQIMHTFAKCVDMRDSQNRGHSFRVAYYTRLLARKLADKRGYTEEQIHEFYNIGLLHDIGKLSIPDAILNKPARLNDEEYVIMKTHAQKGEEILKGVAIVPDLAVGAGCHHERMDGRGYPHALKGEEIPEVARIIAVADTFDAMYSTRPYRKQMLLSDVLAEIDRIKGSQLDPEVVEALFELAKDEELDRAKVDKAVEEAPKLIGMPDEEELQKQEEELKKKNEEFLNSLGLKNNGQR
ncbi:MAG: HD domain-containing protein [Lachnospiraceae bacterium]|nr:HD domain-containing protein [Lachnospiraceae bacterium]